MMYISHFIRNIYLKDMGCDPPSSSAGDKEKKKMDAEQKKTGTNAHVVETGQKKEKQYKTVTTTRKGPTGEEITETVKEETVTTTETKEVGQSGRTENYSKELSFIEVEEKTFEPIKIPVKSFTEKNVESCRIKEIEIGNKGKIKTTGVDIDNDLSFNLQGTIKIGGGVYFKKIYAKSSDAEYRGDIKGTAIVGIESGPPFKIELGLKKFVVGKSCIAFCEPLPKNKDDPVYGLSFDEKAGNKSGAWCVFSLGPAGEDNKRAGMSHFFDNKDVPVEMAYTEGKILLYANGKFRKEYLPE